jgi:hypothetical protein
VPDPPVRQSYVRPQEDPFVKISAVDPPPFRCGPFWDRHNCRYSDAAMVLHETSSFEQGFIARTVGRVGLGRGLRGSLEIDASREFQ